MSDLPILADNPCLACSIDQDCCQRLMGLRVTRQEFDRCFASHAPQLVILREGPVLVVSEQDGGVCPNWREGGCAVYDERPRECRLFPYTLYPAGGSGRPISLRLHSDTRCPLKRQLLGDRDAAQQIAQAFANEAYGASRPVSVQHESPLQRCLRWTRHITHALLATVRGR